MRRRALAGAAGVIAAVAMPFPAAGARPARYAQDGWALAVRIDAFTGRVACMMNSSDRRIVYQPGALGFRFGARRNTLDALYRIDDGPVRRWQDAYPALVAADVAVDGPGLDNPTGGIVWLPVAEVAGAGTVRVRAGGEGAGRLFSLRGFAAMLVAAGRLGCRFD